MDYEIFYNTISNIFDKSIEVEEKQIKKKIYNCLINWYEVNLSHMAKESCKTNDQVVIASIIKKVNEICQKDDYNKIKLTYRDIEFERFKDMSLEIFELIKKQGGKKIEGFDKKYEEYYNDLNDFSNKISPIFLDDYNNILSESLLDLKILKEGKEFGKFSLRTYNYFNSLKSSGVNF